RFRSIIADHNALWEVLRRADNMWACEVVPETIALPGGGSYELTDHVGTVRGFTTDQIAHSLRVSKTLADLAAADKRHKQQVAVGQTVHQELRRGTWVRGEIVPDDGSDDHKLRMRCLELVGDWSERQLTGTVNHDAKPRFEHNVQNVADQRIVL